jgi:hypothetical protein
MVRTSTLPKAAVFIPMRISDCAAWLTICAICTGPVLGRTGRSADPGICESESAPDGWAEPGVFAGRGVPSAVPAVVAGGIADCIAGSAGEAPTLEPDAGGRATVGAITVDVAAGAVVLCGEASGGLSPGLPDCELFSAGLVAVTACAAPSDGADPLGVCAAENWFPEFEVRLEFLPPAGLPLGAGDGRGTAEEPAEEFAGSVAAREVAGVGRVPRGSAAKRGVILFSGACALGEIGAGASGFSVGPVPESDCGSAGCLAPREGIDRGKPKLGSMFWPFMSEKGLFAPAALVLASSDGDSATVASLKI